MKKRYAALALILCLALAGCGPRQEMDAPIPSPSATPSSSPSATPSPTPTPVPSATAAPEPSADLYPEFQEDPKGCLLDCLDKAMTGETVDVWFWQHPGSGPNAAELSVANCGQALRELFSELDWERTECPSYYDGEEHPDAPYNQPGAYSVTIFRDEGLWNGSIGLAKGNQVVRVVMESGTENGTVYLQADGAEELCERIADLTPSLYVNLGRTRVPAQKSREATLKLYVVTALERMKECGHITDYDLRACEIVNSSGTEDQPTEEEHPGIGYTIAYAIKPTHPELWPESKDGWVEVTWGEWYDGIEYDERDGCYGMV